VSKEKPSKEQEADFASTDFLLGLSFDPNDGGDRFLRNVRLSPNYTAFTSHRSLLFCFSWPLNLFMKLLVHSVGEHQSEASPSEAVVNSAVMDGAAVLHQALAGETFLEKERRLSEMIRQLQMLREQLLSQQELQTKVGMPGVIVPLPHTSP
jgi:hypothetical protein